MGGEIIDDEAKLSSFIQQITSIHDKKILVHGGGKLATRLAEKLDIPQQMTEGRRITDAETLKVVTMVYAGFINKNIVAKLQALNCNSIGLSGVDGNIIISHKRVHAAIDYGYVGDIDRVNTSLLQYCLDSDLTIVLAPITADLHGQLLNTNADTVAQSTATALAGLYEVELIYIFEKSGVLLDVNDDTTLIPSLNPERYQQLKAEQKIFAGMIPKLDNAFAAVDKGVKKVRIGKAEELKSLLEGRSGTTIMNE
jgi:acetylglutamate kinase